MADIKARVITGRIQIEMMRAAEARINDTSIAPEITAWADGQDEAFSMFDIATICDCSIDDLISLSADELEKVIEDCRRKNPRFFSMKERKLRDQQEERKLRVAMVQSYPDLIKESLQDSGLTWNDLKRLSPDLADMATEPESSTGH